MTSLSYNGYKGLRQNYYIPVITGTKFNDCVMNENFLKRKFPDCQNKSDDINCFVKINGFNSLIERFLKYFHMENDVKEISVKKIKKNHIVKITLSKEASYIFKNGYCTPGDITEHFGYFSCDGKFDTFVNFNKNDTELILNIYIY